MDSPRDQLQSKPDGLSVLQGAAAGQVFGSTEAQESQILSALCNFAADLKGNKRPRAIYWNQLLDAASNQRLLLLQLVKYNLKL
jgi:hypothetical protein